MREIFVLSLAFITCTAKFSSFITEIEWKKCPSSKYKLETIPSVSVETCAKECGVRHACFSFNYLTRGKICEMLYNDSWAEEDVTPKRHCLHVLRADIKTDNKYDRTGDINVKTCPIPNEENMDVLGNIYTMGARIKTECHAGYRKETDSIPILCGMDAHWTNFTACTNSCLDPPSVMNAEISLGNNSLGEERNYTCLPGTVLQPSVDANITTQCLYGPVWKETHFQCKKDCGDPDSLPNAFVATGQVARKTRRRYKCYKGFVTQFNASYIFRTCLDNGTWSPPSSPCVEAAGNQNNGSSYLFGFLNNFHSLNQARVYIVTPHQTKVTLKTPLREYRNITKVKDGAEIVLPYNEFVPAKTGNYQFGFHLKSGSPVGVYVENSNANSSDGSVIIPEEYLSTEYILISWREGDAFDEFTVVGTAEDTKVKVTWLDGEAFNLTLDRYEQYFHQTTRNITGTLISSSAKVAVFAGNRCTFVITKTCDHLYEQMPPIHDLQREFIVSYPYPRRNYAIRIIAVEDNTGISLSNGPSITLNRKVYSQYQFNNVSVSISATKKVMVAAYALGGSIRPEGISFRFDGSMLIVPGLSQSRSEYNIFVPEDVKMCVLMITYPTYLSNTSSIRRNHRSVVAEEHVKVSIPTRGEYTVMYFRIPKGKHTIYALDGTPFGAFVSFHRYTAESWFSLPYHV